MHKHITASIALFAATAVAQETQNEPKITALPSPLPTTLGPPSCLTALSNIYLGASGCENVDLGTPDEPDIFANTKLAPAIANCICYTKGTYAPKFVDGVLSQCYNDIKTKWTSEPVPTGALGFCEKWGDVKATGTGGNGAKETGTEVESKTASGTESAASASGTSAASLGMKVDWIVMGSASVLAIVSAVVVVL